MEKATSDFISSYVKALKHNNAGLFAGSGLSVNAGYFNWRILLEPIAERLGLDLRVDLHSEALTRYLVSEARGKAELNKLLIDQYKGLKVALSINHQILARLPIQVFWTTNYDVLIEQALVDAGKIPDVKKEQGDLLVDLPKRDAVVYKMRGDISYVADAIFTKPEGDGKEREPFSDAFKSDFMRRTFLFVGFNLTDPNLHDLMYRIRRAVGKKKNPDYCVLKRDSNARIQRRNEIGANLLELSGLRPLWINDYSEIEVILKEIEVRYLQNSIFVSGSAAVYSPYTKEQAGQFLRDLSFALSSIKYKIVSGFGLGVGSAAIDGVLDHVQNQRNQNTDEYLVMRPFPQVTFGSKTLQQIWKEYRQKLMQLSGIALFVFGNKNEGSELANGMEQEFEIALANGLRVIPIGSTGFMAEQLWNRVYNDFETYYPNDPDLKPSFETLGNKNLSLSEIIQVTIGIIDRLNSK
jgi:hypothetical protein